MIYWHYTPSWAFQQIEKDGYLRPSGAGGRIPVVYFSSNQDFELCADKCHEVFSAKPAIGTVRIGVDERSFTLYTFRAFKELQIAKIAKESWLLERLLTPDVQACITGWLQSVMEMQWTARGRQLGYVFDWRVSFDPVPRSAWVAVERWDGERWQPVKCDQGREMIE